MTRLLAISGSLRQMSTNTALLRAMASQAPAGVSIHLFDGLGSLPIFNPDLEGAHTPDSVIRLARQVREADGLIVACPEYAHGIPGGLKNALDWLVSRDEMPFKPVMLVRASHRNAISHAALEEVLRTMSVRLMPEAEVCIHLLGKKGDEIEQALAAPEAQAEMVKALQRFCQWTNAS
jgi:chromate reductase